MASGSGQDQDDLQEPVHGQGEESKAPPPPAAAATAAEPPPLAPPVVCIQEHERPGDGGESPSTAAAAAEEKAASAAAERKGKKVMDPSPTSSSASSPPSSVGSSPPITSPVVSVPGAGESSSVAAVDSVRRATVSWTEPLVPKVVRSIDLKNAFDIMLLEQKAIRDLDRRWAEAEKMKKQQTIPMTGIIEHYELLDMVAGRGIIFHSNALLLRRAYSDFRTVFGDGEQVLDRPDTHEEHRLLAAVKGVDRQHERLGWTTEFSWSRKYLQFERNFRDKASQALEPAESRNGCWGWAITAMRVGLFVVSSICQTGLSWVVARCFGHLRVPQPPEPEFSWLSMMGKPIINTDSSCTISACTMCIEAQHRLAFERINGKGSFQCKAMAPGKLKKVCYKRDVWDSESGAKAGDVLHVIFEMGGVLTTDSTNNIKLPIDGHVLIRQDPDLGRNRFARLLYSRGPVIGSLWAADGDYESCQGECVYRGREEQYCVPGSGAYHAVVCCQYRFRKSNNELQIRIMDNYAADGPLRWVLFEAFRFFYLPLVEKPLEPHQLRRKKKKNKEHGFSTMVKKAHWWTICREIGRYYYLKKREILR
ncbi:uncharacterized protein LOC133886533 [Phragmites australis]|uniref:uncharacterized protein LOC133886533 n=1 Tax=Phragmites australis TaxID=29695 RepID=UPI002D7755C6|nr:uncharacterized protein LOC133886533 [Phragmites australis]